MSVNGEVIEKELEESMNDFAERDYDELVAEGVAQESREAYKHPAGSGEFWFCVGFAGFLTLFAGMMSGLTVGYLSIDELVLELKSQNGTEEEKRCVFISKFIFNKLIGFNHTSHFKESSCLAYHSTYCKCNGP